MNQAERRYFLIKELLKEQPGYRHMEIPRDQTGQKQFLRSLMNVRMPGAATQEFLEVQDAYLQEATAEKGIVNLEDIEPMAEGIYLWQGDITTLRCDAIVNAANSGMTGCYAPCHGCIDNCIHTFSGIQLRLACAELMEQQGHEEETGKAKITPAFNLPCRYVIHTVGPIISGRLRDEDKELLASCYRSCLELAEKNHLESIAFCCISTGEFHFPNDVAAQIAVHTVKEFLEKGTGIKKVIFNVFKDLDKQIYEELLRKGTGIFYDIEVQNGR
ncbi:MAG: protein-ADP-ribose hydrolase [Acetatifactor sp.]|nr:protein-ADP-ribose hydrolase [Acetatifactor sp.]